MSLRIYTNNEEQSFRWIKSGVVYFGLQRSLNNKLLPIYGAEWPVNASITKTEIVKIDNIGKEIRRILINNSLIVYANGQYQTSDSLLLANNLENGIYFLEFTNGTIFKSEPFIIADLTENISNFVFESDNNFIFENGDNFILNK